MRMNDQKQMKNLLGILNSGMVIKTHWSPLPSLPAEEASVSKFICGRSWVAKLERSFTALLNVNRGI